MSMVEGELLLHVYVQDAKKTENIRLENHGRREKKNNKKSICETPGRKIQFDECVDCFRDFAKTICDHIIGRANSFSGIVHATDERV